MGKKGKNKSDQAREPKSRPGHSPKTPGIQDRTNFFSLKFLESFLGYAAVTVAGFLGLLLVVQSQKSPTPQAESIEQASLGQLPGNDFDNVDRMNKHFDSTGLKSALIHAKNSLHVSELTPAIDEGNLTILDRAPHPNYILGQLVNEEDRAGDVIRELEASSQVNELGPADRIEISVAKERWLARYDYELTRAMVKDVIREARKDGYELRFDEELNLVEVGAYVAKRSKSYLDR